MNYSLKKYINQRMKNFDEEKDKIKKGEKELKVKISELNGERTFTN